MDGPLWPLGLKKSHPALELELKHNRRPGGTPQMSTLNNSSLVSRKNSKSMYDNDIEYTMKKLNGL